MRTGTVTAVSSNGHQVEVLIPAEPQSSICDSRFVPIPPAADMQTGWVDLDLVTQGRGGVAVGQNVCVSFADPALTTAVEAQPVAATLPA